MMASRSSTAGAFIGAIAYPATVVLIAASMILYLNKSVFTQFLAIKSYGSMAGCGEKSGGGCPFYSKLVVGHHCRRGCTRHCCPINHEKTMSAPFRATLDKFFPFTIYKQFVAAHVLETLGLLVANGVVFKSALIMMQHKVSPYLAMHLGRMEHLMSKGKGNIADVLDTGLVADR